MTVAIVGDIGGTHARFAVWRDNALEQIEVLATADYSSPESALAAYLERAGLFLGAGSAVCLACAGPVSDGDFQFTNNHWRINRAAFCRALQIERLLLINDFAATALGVTLLEPNERLAVRAGHAQADRPVVVMGPGTGLGAANLLPKGAGEWQALPGEGGHVDLPIGSESEAELWLLLHRQFGAVQAEDVLSGAGLLALYAVVCQRNGQPAQHANAAQICAAALQGESLATNALEQFCVWLGRVAGNHALSLGARGGVYIVGGMVPRFADFFVRSGFAAAFADKGAMGDYLADVPVWLVTAPYPGLLGAGVALQQAG